MIETEKRMRILRRDLTESVEKMKGEMEKWEKTREELDERNMHLAMCIAENGEMQQRALERAMLKVEQRAKKIEKRETKEIKKVIEGVIDMPKGKEKMWLAEQAMAIKEMEEEMKEIMNALGVRDMANLGVENLKSLDYETSALTGIALAGYDSVIPLWK